MSEERKYFDTEEDREPRRVVVYTEGEDREQEVELDLDVDEETNVKEVQEEDG